MYPWTNRRISWYLRAVSYDGFDRVLADAVCPYLPKDEPVCDLGCGTGYLSLELARRGYSVTALDRDETAVAALRAQMDADHVENITPICRDWKTAEYIFDNVLMAFSGNLEEDLPRYLGMARKRLILILKRDTHSHVQESGVNPIPHTSPERLERLLGDRAYHAFDLDAPFGQPLRSIEEAKEYISCYAPAGSKGAIDKLQRRTQGEYPYYLPNLKRMRVYIIPAEAAEA